MKKDILWMLGTVIAALTVALLIDHNGHGELETVFVSMRGKIS
jgi:hypothetical protein